MLRVRSVSTLLRAVALLLVAPHAARAADICTLSGSTIEVSGASAGTLSRLSFAAGESCQVTLHLAGAGYLLAQAQQLDFMNIGKLSFYNGPDSSAAVIEQWTGFSFPLPAVLGESYLTVVWSSNADGQQRGWSLVYGVQPDFCATSGTLAVSALSYGAVRHKSSGANERCRVTFHLDTVGFIVLFKVVRTVGPSDIFKFYDGMDTSATEMDPGFGSSLQSTGQDLTVTWTSGADVQQEWDIQYFGVQDICMQRQTTIQASADPVLLFHIPGLGDFLSCSVVLQAPSDGYVSASFLYLDAPVGVETVNFYDGAFAGPTMPSSSLLGTYSQSPGADVSITVTSTGPSLTVLWSASSRTQGYWVLKYSSLSRPATAVVCGPPAPHIHWDFSGCISFAPGGTCDVRCVAGYVGSPTAQCTAAGTWDYSGDCSLGPIAPTQTEGQTQTPTQDNGWWIGLSAGLAGGVVGLVLLAPLVYMACQYYGVLPRLHDVAPANGALYPYPVAPPPTPQAMSHFPGEVVVQIPPPSPAKPF
eukprot:EG_transcript_3187